MHCPLISLPHCVYIWEVAFGILKRIKFSPRLDIIFTLYLNLKTIFGYMYDTNFRSGSVNKLSYYNHACYMQGIHGTRIRHARPAFSHAGRV